MAIITTAITTLTDLNDAIISGTQPINPTAGTLWIDSSQSPAVLKIYKNGAWMTQDLDLNSLDPDMAESIRNVVATIGNMSNDNLLDYKERQIIKDDLTEILGKVLLDTEAILPTVAQLDSLAKGSFYSTRRNALSAGIEITNTTYVNVATQYQNLKTYLESLAPIKPWNVAVADKDKNVTVIKNTFRDKWLQYYLATEQLSLTTTEKIKEAQENLDGKIDEVSLRDKTEILSGNPVFTDKADDAVVHVGVDGKSVQNAGSGKNLFTPNQNYYTNASNVGLMSWKFQLKPNTQYTASVSDTSHYNVFFDIYLTVASSATGGNGVKNSSPRTITTDSTGLVEISARNNSTTKNYLNILDGTDWVQIEEGSTATVYEPPAPSPDYPSAINSLDKSFDIVSSVGKENLLRKSDAKVLNSSVYGIATYFLTTKPVEGDIYTFTLKGQLGADRSNFVIYNSGGQVILGYVTHTGEDIYKVTFPWKTGTTSYMDTYIRIYQFVSTGVSESSIEWVKLEKGSISTPHSTAPEEISYNTQTPTLYKTNILLSEPLRSVGNVKDRLFLDADGLWKVERNVGEFMLDEKTAWAVGSPTGGWKVDGDTLPYYGYNIPNKSVNKSSTTTRFKTYIGSGLVNTDTEGFSTGASTYSILRINKNRLTTQNTTGLQSWLALNPVTIQYELATPTIETLSAEQQTKLSNIQSFKGSNYVYTIADVVPNLKAKFKSNMWYRMNVLGEKQVSGNRNWATNGNLAYPLEKSLWSSYYKGTVREVVDISTEAPPFKNALHIKQTTNGVAGIIDAVIWEGAEANVLSGQNISMATWIKYQNISNESLVMQVQVTGKTSSGLFSYDYPKVFSHTGTDLTWKRQTGTVKISLPDGAVEITRVAFRLGLAGAGTGEFWATGIQLETGNALGDWSTNPNDTEEELNKTEARFILTEKEIGLTVKKGELINGVLVNGDGVKIDGRNVDINGLVTFGSFDTTTKNAIDAKSTKAEAQGYASDAVTPLKNFTDTAFSDGIIQRAEAQAISEHLNTLKKENDDLGNQYNVVYANVNLIGTPKTNLASAKTAYNTAHTNLVTSINTAISGDKTTPAQKTDVDTKYTAYSTALKLLTQRLTESQTAVSEKIANDLAVAKANLAETSAKAHADGKVTAEETRAIADAKAKLSEAQGYADSAVNNLEIGGRNLVIRNGEWSNMYLVGTETYPNPSSSGAQKNSTMKELISVTAGENIMFTKSSPFSDDYWRVSWLNSSKVYVNRFVNTSNKFMMTVPSGVSYMWISFPTDSKPKVERGTKATDWTPAPEDIDAMIAQAQADADIAKTSSDTATQLLADLSNDNILTPVEKKSVKKEWDIITGEKDKITGEATEYNITGEKNAYITQYNNLQNYITPLLTNLNANSTIVGTTFRTHFKNYYDARQDVLNAITSKAKTLADSAQGTADNVKGVVSNFDSANINANPIFLDWTGSLPTGYASATNASGVIKTVSSNGMGNAVKYSVPAGANTYLNSSVVGTSAYYQYVTVEFTFKLDEGTIDGAGVMFRYVGTANTDHRIHIKDLIPNPVLNKWYTVTKVIKQATQPAGFIGYQVYSMGGWTTFGVTITAKTIQFDSLKSRQATEQEINAYESNIMIADMSSDSVLTPVEKKAVKKEWDIIVSERIKLEAEGNRYGVAPEKVAYSTHYASLSTYLPPLLSDLNANSTIVGVNFRTYFKNYYDARQDLLNAITTKAKALADKAQADIDGLEVGVRNLIVSNTLFFGRYLLETNGTLGSADTHTTTDFISVLGNQLYTVSALKLWQIRVVYYDANKTYISGFLWSGDLGKSKQITTPSNAKFVRLSGDHSNGSDLRNWKLEKGGKATDWTHAPEDVDFLVNNASTLAGTKSKTFTTTPTTPYVSGDVWKNGTAVYISTASRTSGAYVLADWVLVGDVTSANTAKDVSNVGGVASGTVRDRATNGNTAYASTSLWKSTNLTTINGGQITTDTITSGAIKSDVALINKLFVSDANINALTGKSAFINSIKAVDISADRVVGGSLSGVTITSPFNYVYEGTTRNVGTTTIANGQYSSYGAFSGSFGGTYMYINPDTIYAENMKSDGTVRSMYKLSGKGLEVNILGDTASYTQDGIYFEAGGQASVKYHKGNARIEISSYNGVGLGATSSGVYQNRITVGGGNNNLDPFVDIWVPLTMRAGINLSGYEMKNATTVSGIYNLLFQNTSNRIVQGSNNILNIMSPAQIDMGYTNGTTTSNSLSISNAGTTFAKAVQFNGNPLNGANNINGAQTILFHNSSNRIVQGSDGFLNILSPVQLSLGWTDGSSTFTTMIITRNQIVAKRVLNMDSNSITNQSDRRLKKNITIASEDSLNAINRWSFVNYEWIDPEKKKGRHLGLISQDTPELSVYDAESDIYNIDSSKQNMINSHAIQQMYKKFTSEIKKLEDKINEMERTI